MLGRDPWSSGCGRRLKFKRLLVQIPVPDTGWTFILIVKIALIFVLKDRKINEKLAKYEKSIKVLTSGPYQGHHQHNVQ